MTALKNVEDFVLLRKRRLKCLGQFWRNRAEFPLNISVYVKDVYGHWLHCSCLPKARDERCQQDAKNLA